jgi:hypothetical protein
MDAVARFTGAFGWQDFGVFNILFQLDVTGCPAEAAVAAGKGQHPHCDR